MKQTELPLYPKRSSIYNKISQIVIAITLIVVVLSLWSISNKNNLAYIDEHFSQISTQHMAHIKLGIRFSLNNNIPIQSYLDEATKQPWLRSLHWYDPKGILIAKSDQGVAINDLFGITAEKLNKSDEYIPFVEELYTDKLEGYVRITVDKTQFTESLNRINEENLSLFRLIVLVSGLIGFLLTRGFNRFSRQGYRLPKPNGQVQANTVSSKSKRSNATK